MSEQPPVLRLPERADEFTNQATICGLHTTIDE